MAMATSKTPSLLLVVFLVLSELSLASPTGTETPNSNGTAESLNCSSKFSGDYYGLGVRLGIYLTWLTSWVANTFIEEEISGALDANSIFLFALLVSIIKGTTVSGTERLAYIDGLVLMQLCAGYLFGVFSLWGYRTRHYSHEGPKAVRHYGRFGTHCRLCLVTAIGIYGVWFWTFGIRYDLRQGLAIVTDANGAARPRACYPVYVFFFAKLQVLGGIRIFYMISSISTTLYYGGMLVAALAERIRHLTQVLAQEKGHEKRETFRYQTGLTKRELDFLFNLNRVFNLIWIALSVAMVELTLQWNHVLDVLGPHGNISYPAQLLPLMIGSLSFIRILWLLFQKWRNPTESRGADDEATQQKWSGAPGGSTDTPQVGLGLRTGPSPYSLATNAVIEGEDYDVNMARNRSTLLRYTVAYVPWLSQFELWKNPKGHRRLRSSMEENGNGNNFRDSPLPRARASYRTDEDGDLDSRNVPGSAGSSPMIDMKSPTSVNESPSMGYKRV